MNVKIVARAERSEIGRGVLLRDKKGVTYSKEKAKDGGVWNGSVFSS